MKQRSLQPQVWRARCTASSCVLKVKAATDMYGRKWQGRNERIEQKLGEKVEEKAPREEGAEVQSPKREVIRVESEEAHDYVRESLNLSLEEAEHSTRTYVLV